MENKICICCKNEKLASEFEKSNNGKSLRSKCKSCLKEYRRKYYIDNAEALKAQKKVYHIKHGAENYIRNRKSLIAKSKEYHNKNKDKCNHKSKEYHKKNKENQNKLSREWKRQNKHKVTLYRRKYDIARKKTDSKYKMLCTLRNRIYDVLKLKKAIKSKRTLELLGCNLQEFKKHIESKFSVGMNWDNHGKFGWHIDHIKPCASFDLSCSKQQEECFHYINMQPLWWRDNIIKSDNIQ